MASESTDRGPWLEDRIRPETAIACTMIASAIKEMRDRDASHIRDRIDATVWLATKAATRWFEVTGIAQSYALTGMGWTGHANHLLDVEADRPPYWNGERFVEPRAISAEQSAVLRDGLAHFDSHRGPNGSTTDKR
jgi:hypothetical protein